MFALLNNSLEIKLRFLEKEDNPKVKKWLRDPYILELTFVIPGPERRASLPFDEKMMEQYIDVLLSDKSRKTFAIEVDGNHVGNLGLKEIDFQTKKAELFIEIGEAKYRGIGIGKASMAILMDHVFFQMGLEEMVLEVLEFNQAALRVYQQLGFQTSHRSGWHYDENGRYWQVWLMRLPKARWMSQRDQLVLPSNLVTQAL
ncbi:MAG: GNAT family protein [Myxococcaceae bacterium]